MRHQPQRGADQQRGRRVEESGQPRPRAAPAERARGACRRPRRGGRARAARRPREIRGQARLADRARRRRAASAAPSAGCPRATPGPTFMASSRSSRRRSARDRRGRTARSAPATAVGVARARRALELRQQEALQPVASRTMPAWHVVSRPKECAKPPAGNSAVGELQQRASARRRSCAVPVPWSGDEHRPRVRSQRHARAAAASCSIAGSSGTSSVSPSSASVKCRLPTSNASRTASSRVRGTTREHRLRPPPRRRGTSPPPTRSTSPGASTVPRRQRQRDLAAGGGHGPRRVQRRSSQVRRSGVARLARQRRRVHRSTAPR